MHTRARTHTVKRVAGRNGQKAHTHTRARAHTHRQEEDQHPDPEEYDDGDYAPP